MSGSSSFLRRQSSCEREIVNSVSGWSALKSSEGSASTMPRDLQSDRSTTMVWSLSPASLSYSSRKQEASSEFITTSVSHKLHAAPAAPLEIDRTDAATKATALAGLPKRCEN